MNKQSVGRCLAICMAVVACGAVTACGSDDDQESGGGGGSTEASSEKKDITIGLASALDCTNTVVCTLQEAFEAQAEAMGAKAVVLEADIADLVNNQISNMDQLRAQGVDAIAIWPQDQKALAAPIRRAIDADIPVFAHELYDPKGLGITTVVIEGRSLKAKQAATKICEVAPDGGGDVLYGEFGLPNPGLAILRGDFDRYLAECNKPIKVTEFLNKTDDVNGSRPSAEAALQKTPDAFAVDAYNDPTAIGASLAAEQLGKRDQLFISGYNLGDDGVKALERGQIDMSWDYRPAVIGQELARTMIEFASGKDKEPPPVIMVWPKCYTKDTIGEQNTADEDIKAVGAGENLSEADPQLTEEADEIIQPGDSLPGC